MQKKLVVLFLIILLAFIGLSVKLIYINKVDGERYKKQILSQQEYDSKTLPYKRGEIVDANGTKLAYSEKVYNLIVDAKDSIYRMFHTPHTVATFQKRNHSKRSHNIIS